MRLANRLLPYPANNNQYPLHYTGMNRRPGNTQKDGSGKLTCTYCNVCNIHKNTPAAHLEVIKQKRLCYNCLGRHRVSQCSSSNHCHKCNGKHHQASAQMPTKSQVTTIILLTTHNCQQLVTPHSQPSFHLSSQGTLPAYLRQQSLQ